MSSDGGGGGSLVEQGGIFWTGAEIPSSSRLIVASVGGVSPWGTARSRFWRRSRTRRKNPHATTSLNPWPRGMNIAKSSPQGVNFDTLALRNNRRGRGFWFAAARLFFLFFCIRGTKREFFFFRGGNSPVQPLLTFLLTFDFPAGASPAG